MIKWKLTEDNKESLMYHPVLRYVTEKMNMPDIVPAEVINNSTSVLLNNVATDTWEDINGVIDSIDTLIAQIEEKYIDASSTAARDAVAPVTTEENAYLCSLTDETVDFSDGISFKIYKSYVDGGDEPLRTAVMDLYETYHMDVDGLTDVEVYRDLRELRDDWASAMELYKNTTLAMVSTTLPSDLSPGSAGLQSLSDMETAEIGDLIIAQAEWTKLESQISDMILGRTSTDQLAATENSYNTKLTTINTLQDKLNSRAEIVGATKGRLSTTKRILSKIENIASLTTSDSFPNEIEDAVSEAITVFDKDDMPALLASVRTTMDAHMTILKEIEKQRRSISSSAIKSQINTDLTVGSHVCNSLTKPLSRKLRSISDDTTNIEYLLERVTDGIVEADNKYKEQLSAYYRIDQTDSELKMNRLDEVVQKHFTRSYYKLINAIYTYTQDSGAMPTDGDIDNIARSIT